MRNWFRENWAVALRQLPNIFPLRFRLVPRRRRLFPQLFPKRDGFLDDFLNVTVSWTYFSTCFVQHPRSQLLTDVIAIVKTSSTSHVHRLYHPWLLCSGRTGINDAVTSSYLVVLLFLPLFFWLLLLFAVMMLRQVEDNFCRIGFCVVVFYYKTSI